MEQQENDLMLAPNVDAQIILYSFITVSFPSTHSCGTLPYGDEIMFYESANFSYHDTVFKQ